MTDPRKQIFAAYVRTLADRMGLKDWQFVLSDEPPADGTLADILTFYGRKRARIRLSEGFLADPPEEQRQTLTHELIHAHTTFADGLAAESVPEPLLAAYNRAAEYAVDGLADAFAPLLPLPPKSKPPGKR